MGNSDSDSENECFESAEESLDEEEEEEEVKRTETKLKKNDSEVNKPVSDSDVSSAEITKGISSSSMSYRKRPDSVKRTISKTKTKPLAKLPSADIFRADKIVPDAFFHDITNNLSRNINKSLSTLQQKSSNIKDLIFSTFPVSSVDDNEGFLYDDNTVYALSGKDEFTNAEGNALNKNHEIEHDVGKIKKEEISQKETISTNSSVDLVNCSNNKENQQCPSTDSLKGSLEANSNLKGTILVDEVKEEINDNTVKEKQCASDINMVDSESHKKEKASVSEKDSELRSKGIFSKSNSTESLRNQDKVNNIDINKLEIVNNLHETDKKPEMMETVPTEFEKTIPDKDYTQSLECEKSSGIAKINQSPLDENSVTSSELIMQNTLPIPDGKILPEDDDDDEDLNPLVEVKKSESQCNLEELKLALENIVKDKTNSLNENNGVLENKPTKKNFIDENKIEVPQSSNDGWEDFDFSDNEIDNIEANKTNFKGADLKEKGGGIVDDDTALTEIESLSNNKECAKTAVKVISEAAINTKLIVKEKVHSEKKNDFNVIKVSEHIPETESTPDDTWDWNDSWDETSGDKNQEAEVAAAKSKSEKIQDDTSDISKWTGWDTFGQKPAEKQGNWSLGSWGVDMLLNKATAVTQGISNALEAGLGAPDPETLARMEKAEWEKLKEQKTEEEDQGYSGEISKKNSITNVNLFPVSGITNLVAGVTSKIVEHSKIQEIGSKVITGGLDTLETFGKKTMEVLQEGDPGLKNKRALLMGNTKPILSQVLREAREKADREMKKVEEKEIAKKCNFETLFDDFQGMVHLEALEMLSRQCELKLEQIRIGMNSEEQEDLNGILEEVEQLCALDECELDLKSSVLDFKTALQMVVEPLKNEISVHKIIQIQENTSKWLEMSSETEPSLTIINQKLVSTLAELSAATVQQFHKSGELLSVKECRKTVEEVDALSRLTNVLCTEINRLCEKFILLSRNKGDANAENLNSLAEKVNVVMKNSTSYIRQAFDLLIPVIQLGAAV